MGFIVFLLVVIIGILLYIAIKYQNANKKMHETLDSYVANHKMVSDIDLYRAKQEREAEMENSDRKSVV